MRQTARNDVDVAQIESGAFSNGKEGMLDVPRSMDRVESKEQGRSAGKTTADGLEWWRRLQTPSDWKAAASVAIVLVLVDALLSAWVVYKVPYTEIDWKAYMSQVESFRNGERNYSKLVGETGPCVYPAGYVYIYAILQKMTGGDVLTAQIMFWAVYLLTLGIVFAVYIHAAVVPPWAFSLLILSKRVHSIYMLRLFNDCFAMLFSYAAIMAIQRLHWVGGLVLFSFGVSVKMNVLLMAPSLLMLMLQSAGVSKSALAIGIAGLIQIALGLPFLMADWWEYVKNAFNIGRKFIYFWSVNFKFVPESMFSSGVFATILLLMHLVVLFLFTQLVWCKHQGGIWSSLNKTAGRRNAVASPDRIATVLFTSNLIGVFFARSLHYQFYSWYFHMIPLLLWKTNLPTGLRLALWFVIEVCWNIFPSNAYSSVLLLLSHFCILVALWRSQAGAVVAGKGKLR